MKSELHGAEKHRLCCSEGKGQEEREKFERLNPLLARHHYCSVPDKLVLNQACNLQTPSYSLLRKEVKYFSFCWQSVCLTPWNPNETALQDLQMQILLFVHDVTYRHFVAESHKWHKWRVCQLSWGSCALRRLEGLQGRILAHRIPDVNQFNIVRRELLIHTEVNIGAASRVDLEKRWSQTKYW